MKALEKKMNPSLKKQIKDSLAQVITDIRDKEEALRFLEDFFTPSELEIFSKRLGVAYWLKKGRSYANIKSNLKVSSATVAFIHTLMAKPGVKLALKKLEAEEWANKWAERIKSLVR